MSNPNRYLRPWAYPSMEVEEDMKNLKDHGCPNTALRVHVCLTPKQIKAVMSSLHSTIGLRSTEKERAYLRKIFKKFEEVGT